VPGRRAAEVSVALAAAGAGLVVMLGALRHETSWTSTGPGAGYFPLRIGILLSATGLLLALRHGMIGDVGRFAQPGAARRVLRLFLPTAILAVSVAPLGAYLPMTAYLIWMGRMEARLSWPRAVAVALGLPGLFYLVFDVWLFVPLAKGPVERWLGIW